MDKEGGGVTPLPGDETSVNEEGGGVAPLPHDKTYANEGGGVLVMKRVWMRSKERLCRELVETSVNEEGLPSSLVMKLIASKYNTS